MPDVIDREIEEEIFGDILLDEFEIFVAGEMGDVIHAAGDEVVNGHDFVASLQQVIHEVGAEEARAAGNDGGRLFDRTD